MTCSVKVTQGAGSQTPGSLPGLPRVHHGRGAEASLSGSPHHSCIPHQPEDSLGLETDPDSFPIKPGSQCGPAPGFFVFPQSCPDHLRAFLPALLRNQTHHPVESFGPAPLLLLIGRRGLREGLCLAKVTQPVNQQPACNAINWGRTILAHLPSRRAPLIVG